MFTQLYFVPTQPVSGYQYQLQQVYGYQQTQAYQLQPLQIQQQQLQMYQQVQPFYNAQSVVYPAQQSVYTAVNPYMPGGAVLYQPQQNVLPCSHSPGATACWMHRPAGELMQLPAPAPGRPGQWIQWCNGAVTWLAAPIETL